MWSHESIDWNAISIINLSLLCELIIITLVIKTLKSRGI